MTENNYPLLFLNRVTCHWKLTTVDSEDSTSINDQDIRPTGDGLSTITLSNITLEPKRGNCHVIGSVGRGKLPLILVIARELPYSKGHIMLEFK